MRHLKITKIGLIRNSKRIFRDLALTMMARRIIGIRELTIFCLLIFDLFFMSTLSYSLLSTFSYSFTISKLIKINDLLFKCVNYNSKYIVYNNF